ncbi:MAG: M23 family metallopeptidase [Flavobacteriales bacterium]|nr:M23 family metallopeptidase [Flavobacteriales bacterium]
MLHPARHSTLIFSVLIVSANCAQEARSTSGFIAPMDIPLELAGNFMEPRSDHFHSGLDLRTQGREGIPVKSVADGWVSRIKISPWGYGKAVYIDHPDGHTSVYGHLQVLQGPLADACLAQQYKQKDFSIDWAPEKGALPVKQGEVIALSGNTGGSGGPHLHFELRRTSDQHALDPEALGISIADHKAPEIHGVRLYALTDSSRTMPYPAKAVGFAAQGGDGKYTLKEGAVPFGYGTIGLAIHTLDRYDAHSAKCGVRSIELFVDSVPVFSTRFEQLDFAVNRYCNAHMDYGQFKGNKLEYHRCYRQPNNKLRIYGKEEAQGLIELAPGQERHVRFLITDAHGNKSTLTFTLRGAPLSEASAWPREEPSGSLFRYDASNSLTEEGLRFTMPAMALYDDALVRYANKPAVGRALTPIHSIGDPLIPIHAPSDLSLALGSAKPSKAVIVRLDSDGTVASALGGKYADGWITTQVKTFGSYTVMLDTVPPVITNVDLRADMKGRQSFSIKIADNLAGIDTWTGTLNGEWILLEYDPKSKLLKHTFDTHSKAPGKKEFKLVVTDSRSNTTSYALSFSH